MHACTQIEPVRMEKFFDDVTRALGGCLETLNNVPMLREDFERVGWNGTPPSRRRAVPPAGAEDALTRGRLRSGRKRVVRRSFTRPRGSQEFRREAADRVAEHQPAGACAYACHVSH